MGEHEEQFVFEMGYNKGFKDGIKGSIPKADYEARLRADMVAMLTEIQLEFEELEPEYDCNSYSCGIADCYRTIQEKITSLKEARP